MTNGRSNSFKKKKQVKDGLTWCKVAFKSGDIIQNKLGILTWLTDRPSYCNIMKGWPKNNPMCDLLQPLLQWLVRHDRRRIFVEAVILEPQPEENRRTNDFRCRRYPLHLLIRPKFIFLLDRRLFRARLGGPFRLCHLFDWCPIR